MAKQKRISGLKNIHYATLLEDTVAGAKYSAPKPLEGAISVSAELEFGESKFFSDDKVDTLINSFAGMSGELVVTGVTGDEMKDLFGYSTEKGLTKVTTDALAPNLALMFETTFLDNTTRKYVLYNVVMKPSNVVELSTRTEEIEETSYSIEFTGIALAQDEVYAFIDSDATDIDQDVFDGWYTKVQGVVEIVEP